MTVTERWLMLMSSEGKPHCARTRTVSCRPLGEADDELPFRIPLGSSPPPVLQHVRRTLVELQASVHTRRGVSASMALSYLIQSRRECMCVAKGRSLDPRYHRRGGLR